MPSTPPAPKFDRPPVAPVASPPKFPNTGPVPAGDTNVKIQRGIVPPPRPTASPVHGL